MNKNDDKHIERLQWENKYYKWILSLPEEERSIVIEKMERARQLAAQGKKAESLQACWDIVAEHKPKI